MIAKRGFGICLLVLSMTAGARSLSAAAGATEGWDAGSLNGWTANTAFSTVSVVATGGNPDGYLLDANVNTIDVLGAATALEPWVGDFDAARIFQIQVDLRFFGGDGLINPRLRFRESSVVNGWFFVLDPVGTDDGLWHHYEVAIDPAWSDADALAAGWQQESGTPSFAATMGSVDFTEVRADGAISSESIGIDNYTLVAVPSLLEVPALKPLGLGLLALALAAFALTRLARRRLPGGA